MAPTSQKMNCRIRAARHGLAYGHERQEGADPRCEEEVENAEEDRPDAREEQEPETILGERQLFSCAMRKKRAAPRAGRSSTLYSSLGYRCAVSGESWMAGAQCGRIRARCRVREDHRTLATYLYAVRPSSTAAKMKSSAKSSG